MLSAASRPLVVALLFSLTLLFPLTLVTGAHAQSRDPGATIALQAAIADASSGDLVGAGAIPETPPDLAGVEGPGLYAGGAAAIHGLPGDGDFGLRLQTAPSLSGPLETDDFFPDAPLSGEAGTEQGEPEDDYPTLMRRRIGHAKLHRLLGISTWSAMTVAVALGTIQYHNLYGWWASRAETPCVRGTATFGQTQCYGHPWPHMLAAGVTTGLYVTTGTYAWLMPDPDDSASGPGQFAGRLRLHKVLRWVHLASMVAQALLGPVIANPHWAGLGRPDNYGTLRTLATAHLAAGVVGWGALGAAGYLMLF